MPNDHAEELADARAQLAHLIDAHDAADDAAGNARARAHAVYGDEQSWPCSSLHHVRTLEDRRDDIATRMAGTRAYMAELNPTD